MTNPEQNPATRPDADLLRDYVRSGSEAAFSVLVEKYLGMVLGIARRRTGSSTLAEDVAQNVFTIFARKARGLKATPTIAGWIHRVAMVECAAALRKEHNRDQKMKRVTEQLLNDAEGQDVWLDVHPHLDEVIDELSPGDRNIVLLRFWENKSFREIAATVGKTEGASQKQAERALEKLSRKLRRRGVAISAAALTTGFATALTATAAPAALVTTISQGALTAAPTLTTGTLILKSIEAMTYAKTKTALAVAVVAAVPLGIQWKTNQHLQQQLIQLEGKVASQPTTAKAPSAAPLSNSAPTTSSILRPEKPTARSVTPTDAVDLTAQWRQALYQTDPLKRSLAINTLLNSLTPENALEIAAVFDAAHQTGARYTEEHKMFMRAWGAVDGANALRHALDQAGETKGSPVVLSAIAGWATTDPTAARDWVENLEDGQAKEDIIVGLLDGWAIVDHESASRYIESRPRTPARNRARQMLLERALMTGGIPAAQNWFRTINGEDNNKMYKQLAFDELTTRMLAHDPLAVADYIKANDGENHTRGRAIRNTARTIASTDPAAAIDFVTSLENLRPGQLTGTYSDIVHEWAQADPGAAGNWLNTQADHPRHDVMVNRYISSIADLEPALALQWANTIDNDNRRRSSQMIAAASLLKAEGDAAIPTLKAAGLTDAMIKSAPNHAELMKQLSGRESFAEQNLIIGESTVTIGAPRNADQPK